MGSKSKRKPTARRAWGEWEEREPSDAVKRMSVELEGAESVRAFGNGIYRVLVYELPDGITHLSIRNERNTAIRDWRDMQRIKNELTDPEREAVELYPAESRLVDTSNQFHLWVAPPGAIFPIGWNDGRVVFDELPDEAARALQDRGMTLEGIRSTRQRRLP